MHTIKTMAPDGFQHSGLIRVAQIYQKLKNRKKLICFFNKNVSQVCIHFQFLGLFGNLMHPYEPNLNFRGGAYVFF